MVNLSDHLQLEVKLSLFQRLCGVAVRFGCPFGIHSSINYLCLLCSWRKTLCSAPGWICSQMYCHDLWTSLWCNAVDRRGLASFWSRSLPTGGMVIACYSSESVEPTNPTPATGQGHLEVSVLLVCPFAISDLTSLDPIS
jgi:hypothetical protein